MGASATLEEDPFAPGRSERADSVTSDDAIALLGEAEVLDLDPCPRGTVVGRYVVLGLVGQGGMGLVYRAYDPELHREVALKLLRPDRHGRPDAQLRLRREAQAMARISHPHVLPVYDVGTYAGRVFVAMEFVRSKTLGVWLREDSPSPEQILGKFIESGRGLAAAHAVGLIHRDFKPHNVLLGDDGRARVMDFGLARAKQAVTPPPGQTGHLGELDGLEPTEPRTASPASDGSLTRTAETPLTATGNVVGTPRYMAPEQHRGLDIDARADQFSFCAALWEALYRSRPFGVGNARRLGRRKVRGAIENPQQTHGVPPWLQTVLRRGMNPDPAQRWPDMDSLLRELVVRRSRHSRSFVYALIGAVALVATLVAIVLTKPSGDVASGGTSSRTEAALPASVVRLRADMLRERERVSEAIAAGDYLQARAYLDELSVVATRLGDKALSAEILALQAEVLGVQGEAVVARDHAVQGLHLALAEGAGALAVELAVDLVDYEGVALQRPAEGHRWASMARALMDAHGSTVAIRARLLAHEANVFALQSDAERARADFERALTLAVVATTDPEHVSSIAERAADALVGAGDHAGARRFRAEAIDQHLSGGGPNDAALLGHRAGLAAVDLAEGRYVRARDELEQVLARQEERLGLRHPRLVDTLVDLGHAHRGLASLEEALRHYTQALAIERECCSTLRQAELQSHVAMALADLGRFDEAGDAVDQAGALLAELPEPPPRSMTANLFAQGHVAQAEGEVRRAADRYRRVIERTQTSAVADARVGCAARVALAHIEAGGDEAEAARPRLERVLADARHGTCSDPSTVAAARFELARLLEADPALRPRARVLAELAAQRLSGGIGSPVLLADVRQWLAAH